MRPANAIAPPGLSEAKRNRLSSQLCLSKTGDCRLSHPVSDMASRVPGYSWPWRVSGSPAGHRHSFDTPPQNVTPIPQRNCCAASLTPTHRFLRLPRLPEATRRDSCKGRGWGRGGAKRGEKMEKSAEARSQKSEGKSQSSHSVVR